MKIAIAGAGYVGLVTAACLAEKGHDIICLDIDEKKIDTLNKNNNALIYEENLDYLMRKNKNKLVYTTDYSYAYETADIIFVAVGTPEKKDGSANLSYVFATAKQIIECIKKDCVIVIKSTVPIGTNEKIEKILHNNNRRDIKFSIVSNPEFLSQGTAVHDTLYASRIVIGVEDEWAKKVMLKLYEKFDVPKLVTDRRSAEMIKYASNDFLALKISYINEIANLCEKIGANIDDVTKGMGYDDRIGSKFLQAGIGYGGSCFPKDTKALHWLANFHDYEIKTIKAAIEVNENQKLKLIKKARKYYESFEGLTIAVLGLAFKPGTDDLREAPAMTNIPILLDDGAEIKVYDPIAQEKFKNLMQEQVVYCSSISEAIEGADLCFIFTEWQEIKTYDINEFLLRMHHAIVIDGRNCFKLEQFIGTNIIYESIGRETVS